MWYFYLDNRNEGVDTLSGTPEVIGRTRPVVRMPSPLGASVSWLKR
jgi:hypothetical protein